MLTAEFLVLARALDAAEASDSVGVGDVEDSRAVSWLAVGVGDRRRRGVETWLS